MALFTKRYHEPGTLPGTLVATVCEAPLRITLVEFTDEAFEERVMSSPADCVSPEECREYLASPSKTWIHVQGCVTPDTLRQLGEMFGLHVLALEDVLNTGQRTKLEDYDSQLFLAMHLPLRTDAGLVAEQISLFLGPNYLISFHAGATDPFEPVRARLRQHDGRIRQRGTDFLLYSLVDLIVDQGFPLLEEFGEDIESIEQTLLGKPDEAVLGRIHRLRRELLLLRRLIWPQSEVLRQLLHEDYGCIEDKTRVFLRDCNDHALHILELLESYREMTSAMLEAYLSSASNRLNEVMRVLTVIATIFMALTFIVGIRHELQRQRDEPLGHAGAALGLRLPTDLAPGGELRHALERFPLPRIAERVLEGYFIPGGKAASAPFRLTPMPALSPRRDLLELTVVANFVEVFLAREGHENPVGINYLEKIQLPYLPSIYGAMLAGVACVIVGAGMATRMPGVLDRFADHKPASYEIQVTGAEAETPVLVAFDPSEYAAGLAPLERPAFLSIVSSNVVASTMVKRSNGRVDGFIVARFDAGGLNAPPRGRLQLDDIGQPVYGEKDQRTDSARAGLGGDWRSRSMSSSGHPVPSTWGES